MRGLRGARGRRGGPGRRAWTVVSVALGGTGLILLGGQGWVKGKGALASVLIERAWEAHLADGGRHRPWPWADMRPLARLEVPRLGIRRVVLSGGSGEALAFGLAHVAGTAAPGKPGNVAIAGHRDTWAAFLRDVRAGDEVRVITAHGRRSYVIEEVAVVGKDRVEVLEPAGEDRITLITCYPFEGVVRSPWRVVIVARSHAKRDAC